MRLEVLKYLEDVIQSVSAIEQYTSDLSTAEDYENDLETIDAVERRLSIIGEAIFQANKYDSNLLITGKHKIIGLRHILVHSYDLVTNSTIWGIVQNNLPILKTEIESILKDLE